MAYAVYIPRLNNNDDEVRLTDVFVRPGDPVAVGQTLAEVETDKATVAVEADEPGYVLRIIPEVQSMVPIGSVLLWIGETAEEAVPDKEGPGCDQGEKKSSAEPTAKARALIAQHNLRAADIPTSGERLTAADVEAYLSGPRTKPVEAARPGTSRSVAAGGFFPLSMDERGMLRSVLWHRDEAVPAYLELEFDQKPWEEYSKAYAAERRMLADPLLGLMAHRLVTIAREHPKLNSTIIDDQRYRYEHVNLGFTIQVQERLYLVVVQQAETKEPHAFIEALNRLHRKAMAHNLAMDDVEGATVAFSSMARWRVSRHVPILPRHVSLIVAHTVSKENRAVFGATYDHRVLSGGDTVAVLSQLCQPPQ